jgi:hypothetical protein
MKCLNCGVIICDVCKLQSNYNCCKMCADSDSYPSKNILFYSNLNDSDDLDDLDNSNRLYHDDDNYIEIDDYIDESNYVKKFKSFIWNKWII